MSDPVPEDYADGIRYPSDPPAAHRPSRWRSRPGDTRRRWAPKRSPGSAKGLGRGKGVTASCCGRSSTGHYRIRGVFTVNPRPKVLSVVGLCKQCLLWLKCCHSGIWEIEGESMGTVRDREV